MALSAYANIGHGAQLFLGADSTNTGTTQNTAADTTTANFTAIAELRNINPDLTCGEADVTSNDSAGVRHFLPTYLEGTVSASLNWIPADADASPVVLDTMQARITCTWMIRVPVRGSTAGTSVDLFFLGFVTGLRPTIEGDVAQTADVSWRIADSTLVD